MNATSEDNGFFGYNSESGFSYGIGVSIGILILITTITLASYFCAKSTDPSQRQQTTNNDDADNNGSQHVLVDVGIDEATLRGYPKLLYSTKVVTNPAGKDSTASCCSICLADYKNKDVLRLLPHCGHIFHLKCVDPWLRSHATCPVCRTSPFPTPLSTPRAEVVPLGRSRQNY